MEEARTTDATEGAARDGLEKESKPAKKARAPRDPERRKRQIAEAAAELIAQEGTRHLTHRRVAERAGVPLGSTTQHFKSIDDLRRAGLMCLSENIERRNQEILARTGAARATVAHEGTFAAGKSQAGAAAVRDGDAAPAVKQGGAVGGAASRESIASFDGEASDGAEAPFPNAMSVEVLCDFVDAYLADAGQVEADAMFYAAAVSDPEVRGVFRNVFASIAQDYAPVIDAERMPIVSAFVDGIILDTVLYGTAFDPAHVRAALVALLGDGK